jgi:hypothetical protein
VKKSENGAKIMRELSGRFPFGLLRRDAASFAREFEAPDVFYKRNCLKRLGFGWKVRNCGGAAFDHDALFVFGFCASSFKIRV